MGESPQAGMLNFSVEFPAIRKNAGYLEEGCYDEHSALQDEASRSSPECAGNYAR
jgi:hypothetical protein